VFELDGYCIGLVLRSAAIALSPRHPPCWKSAVRDNLPHSLDVEFRILDYAAVVEQYRSMHRHVSAHNKAYLSMEGRTNCTGRYRGRTSRRSPLPVRQAQKQRLSWFAPLYERAVHVRRLGSAASIGGTHTQSTHGQP